MDESTLKLNSEKSEKAKAYQKERQRLTLINLFLTPAILALVLASGLSHLFRNFAERITVQPFVIVGLYFAFLSIVTLLFDYPFSFYSGFVIEHRYGLSNHTFASWLKDVAKKSVLSFALSLVLIELMYAIIWTFPSHWWLISWGGYLFVSYGLGKVFPIWIVPLFYKYGPVANESLKKRIYALAERYQMPLENIYSLNLSKSTKKANAAFMGLGKTKRVVLSDTLLEHFTPDEIEVVVAHELGHFKRRDVWKQLLVGAISSFIAFWLASVWLPVTSENLGFKSVGDVASLPFLFLIFYGFFLVVTPLLNAHSRWIERNADRFALKAFPFREHFVSCMQKLARVNLADPEPHPIFEWFFYDHPSIGKRIRMAQKEAV